MARLNWDKGLSLVQRRAILRGTYSAIAFVIGMFCVLHYANKTIVEHGLWLLGLGLLLLIATIILSLSSALELMLIDTPSNKILNEDRS